MEYLKKLIEYHPFEYDIDSRNNIFFHAVLENFDHQLKNSHEYRNWSNVNHIYDSNDINSIEDIPFFPSSIFKYATLSSTQTKFKSIESSGTTSQAKSKIYLDKASNKKLFEIHPELSFMAMNNMKVLSDSKKTVEGRKKRLKLINSCYPHFNFSQVREKFLRKDVADDDILDVIAVLWSTQKIIDNIASYVPKKPETPKSKIYF